MNRRDLKLVCALTGVFLTAVVVMNLDHRSEIFVTGLVDRHRDSSRGSFVPNPTSVESDTSESRSAVSVKPSLSTEFRPLSLSVVNGVKAYVFFIGMPRSGHSIVAAILDSHPHIVISNELDVFKRILSSPNVTRQVIFNQIWDTSYKSTMSLNKDTSKGYSLAIDGLYQGTYDSHIDVMGDKMGGSTADVFLYSRNKFESRLNMLRTVTNLPIKVFHVIRNPFDNIATISIFNHFRLHSGKVAMVKESNLVVNVSQTIVDDAIRYYFKHAKAAEDMRQRYNLDSMEVHGSDLVASPQEIITKMCTFLQVFCSDDYVSRTSAKIFGGESKTRYRLKWTDLQIVSIQENIKMLSSLMRYLDFDS